MTEGGGLPPLRDVIARHGLGARKALGQHFLLDTNLTDRIARAAGDLSAGTTIEVGPGPGGLTRSLLANGAARVVAVERDERCLAALAELAEAYPGRLATVADDALGLDVPDLGAPPRRIVANLPYNVGTPLLLTWLAIPDALEAMVLMLQREVVDRLAAAPGTKSYGRLSVAAQWRWTVTPLFNIPAEAFTPPPKVTSTVVRLVPRPEPLAPAPAEALERVTRAAFGQRRKMLRRSLKSLGDAEALCAAAAVSPEARAEAVSVEGFCALARAVGSHANGL